jgi:cytochrome c oxidase subunit IV
MGDPDELVATPRRRFRTEVLIYTPLAVFLVSGGVIYGVWSGEQAGTALLILTGVFAGIVAGYLALQDRLERRTARAPATESGPVEEDQFLPHASLWPFEMGAGMALALSGVVLGWAIFVPGVILVVHALVGWTVQSRHRSPH